MKNVECYARISKVAIPLFFQACPRQPCALCTASILRQMTGMGIQGRKWGEFLNGFIAVGHTIWGIPGYFFCTCVGFTAAVSMFIVLVSEKRYSLPVNMRILFVSLFCLLLWARLFGCLSGIFRDAGMGRALSWEGVKNTGIVFYGGLFGFLASWLVCLKRTGQDACIMDLTAVAIPLFHAIARVGCFVGGCCYGRKSTGPFSILYTTSVLGQVETAERIPIQLIEAAFNLALFLYLFQAAHREDWRERHLSRSYLLLYSVGRFLLEFFRGDLERGVLYGISFSQAISVLIWIFLAAVACRSRRSPVKREESKR